MRGRKRQSYFYLTVAVLLFIKKILLQSASPVFCSCVSRPLCVCESDSVLQRAIHGEKGGWEQEKRRERGSANALVQEEVKEM